MTNPLLTPLWINASDRQPIPGDYSSLIGKLAKSYTGTNIVIKDVQPRAEAMGGFVITDTSDGVWILNQIEWFDDSPEAVKELRSEILKPLYRSIKDYVLSLDTPDNEVYKNNSLLIQSCFAKAMELIEEAENKEEKSNG